MEKLMPTIIALLPVIRFLHVLFGAFWVGAVFFQMLFLEPRLKALGPRVQQPVMGGIMPRLVPAMMVTGLTVAITGLLMTLAYRFGRLDTLLSSGWGTAMVIGMIATAGAMAVGLGGLTPTGMRIGRLTAQLDGQPPSPEQAATLASLSQRMDMLSLADFALVFVAVAMMPLARFL